MAFSCSIMMSLKVSPLSLGLAFRSDLNGADAFSGH